MLPFEENGLIEANGGSEVSGQGESEDSALVCMGDDGPVVHCDELDQIAAVPRKVTRHSLKQRRQQLNRQKEAVLELEPYL